MRWFQTEKCDWCGRFMNCGEIGASWSQTWQYAMDGTPDLNDPDWRCAKCTEKHGPRETNCGHPERYKGINRAEPLTRANRS